jgi:uncharacterized membrane protein YcaP (DUF421 family)
MIFMSPTDAIQPFDLQRMFLGDLPWWFTVEVVVRTIIMYVYSLVLIRLVSRRAIGQLSLIEFLLVIALGSAVGDPMFYDDVPLLHAMIVITVVIFLNRLVVHWINASEFFETFMEGVPITLIEDGLINTKNLDASHLNREKLFERLRTRSITHLGEIDRAYLEQGGELAVYRREPAGGAIGLRITPPWDICPPQYWRSGQQPTDITYAGCERCGNIIHYTEGPLPPCLYCGSKVWTDAVVL